MKGCFWTFVVLIVGVPAALVAAFWIGVDLHSASLHYRLTLVVEADGTEHTGSGVIAVECETTFWLFQGMGGESCTATGEAIPIDLGSQGYLFVTLHGRPIRFNEASSPELLPWLAFPDAGEDAKGHRNYLTAIRALRGTSAQTDLPLAYLPMLVRFEDPKDPKSVEEVDPKDLEDAYGSGAQIVSATIAITDDALTTGIEKVLPWVDTMAGATLDEDTSVARSPTAPLNNHLGSGDFEIGVERW